MTQNSHQLADIHALLERGAVAPALQQIEALIGAGSASAPAWHLAGIIRRRAGNPAAAVEAFEKAISMGIDSAEIHNSLGLALQDAGSREKARHAFEQAIEKDVSYTEASVNAGRLAASEGEFEGAERVLRRALQVKSKSPLLHNALAAVLHEAGDSKSASEHFQVSSQIDPGNLVAVVRFAETLRELGRSPEALEFLVAHEARFRGAPEFAEILAGTLLDNGRVAEAEERYERLAREVPGYFAAHRALARLAVEYATGKDPYRSYRALVAQWPDEWAIWENWLSLTISSRDFEMTISLAEKARSRFGANSNIDYFEAIALSEISDAQKAEMLFQRIEPIMDRLPHFWDSRARNALRRAEPEQAEAAALRSTTLDPKGQFGWAYLGLAWRLLDDDREFWLHDYERQVEQRPLDYLSAPEKLEELRLCLEHLHRASNHPLDQSLRKGTQTEGALFRLDRAEIAQLRDEIRAHVRDYAANLPDDNDHPFYRRKAEDIRFVGSWSVRLKDEGFHLSHVHPAGWISSALHLTVPEAPRGSGANDSAGKLVLGQPPSELGIGLSPRKTITPQEGSLVLFPSSMWHGTVPIDRAARRLSVAFDCLPVKPG
ncbi:putative 2OG-Fe(II) oxygenase [Qipengyuania pelagi]